MNEALKKAAQHLVAGRLEACHLIAQEHEGLEGNYLHAILHRKEGDFDNSLYWFRRAHGHPVAAAMSERFPGWTPEKFVAFVRSHPNDPAVAEQEAAELECVAKYYA